VTLATVKLRRRQVCKWYLRHVAVLGLGPGSFSSEVGQEPRCLQQGGHQHVSQLLESAHCAALPLARCKSQNSCSCPSSLPPGPGKPMADLHTTHTIPVQSTQTPHAKADHQEAKCGDISSQ
jgi:hypothetical protein